MPVGMPALTGSVSHPFLPIHVSLRCHWHSFALCVNKHPATSLAMQGKPLWQRPSPGVCSWFRRHRLLILITPPIMTTASFIWCNLLNNSIQLNSPPVGTYLDTVCIELFGTEVTLLCVLVLQPPPPHTCRSRLLWCCESVTYPNPLHSLTQIMVLCLRSDAAVPSVGLLFTCWSGNEIIWNNLKTCPWM